MTDQVLQRVRSVHGNIIRITATQWVHITEAHDYMSGNLDKVLETLSEPTHVLAGERGELLALREYAHTSITRKTVIVVYRDEPDGFVITAFFTSRPDRIEKTRERIWPR